MSGMINILRKILKLKFRFNLPDSKKILLFDEMHSKILREIIKKDFNILKVRDDKEIYFWIYLDKLLFWTLNLLLIVKIILDTLHLK